jgi:hypothetical protein
MKRFSLGLAVLAIAALMTASAAAQNIDQVQPAPLNFAYTAADQQVMFENDTAGNLLFTFYLDDSSTHSNELTVDPVNFMLNGFLYDDRSSGGMPWGRFNNGGIDLYWEDVSTGDIWSIDGTLVALEIRETSECIFDGSGQFIIEDMTFPAGVNWPSMEGSIATFTFVPTICPEIDDWSQDFDGIGYATMVPNGSGFPEPATCLLVVGLALAARRRK